MASPSEGRSVSTQRVGSLVTGPPGFHARARRSPCHERTRRWCGTHPPKVWLSHTTHRWCGYPRPGLDVHGLAWDYRKVEPPSDRDDPDHPDPTNFAARVRATVEPLLARHGFALVSEQARLLKYESDRVWISVWHQSYENEVALEFGRIGHDETFRSASTFCGRTSRISLNDARHSPDRRCGPDGARRNRHGAAQHGRTAGIGRPGHVRADENGHLFDPMAGGRGSARQRPTAASVAPTPLPAQSR